jgi:hypothetical protein
MKNILISIQNDLPKIQSGISLANNILDDSTDIVQQSREQLTTVPQIIESEFNSINASIATID